MSASAIESTMRGDMLTFDQLANALDLGKTSNKAIQAILRELEEKMVVSVEEDRSMILVEPSILAKELAAAGGEEEVPVLSPEIVMKVIRSTMKGHTLTVDQLVNALDATFGETSRDALKKCIRKLEDDQLILLEPGGVILVD